MKLKSIRPRNFKNHADTEIEFSEFVTILLGKQGSGKSSVCDAIVCAFIGRTRLTDQRGSGLKEHIRNGQKEFFIDLTFSSNGTESTIVRGQNQTKQTLISPFGGEDLRGRQALLLQGLGLAGSPEAIECLLDPSLFAERDRDEQRAILLKLVKTAKIEIPKAVLDFGIRDLPTIGTINEHIKSIHDSGGTIPQLNKEIKTLVEHMPTEPEPAEWEKLRWLQRRAEELAAQDREAQGSLGALRQKLEQARSVALHLAEAEKSKVRLSEKEALLKSLAEKLMAINLAEVERLKKELAEKEQSLQEVARQLKALGAEVVPLRDSIKTREIDCARLEGETRGGREQLEDLKSIGDVCPKCRRPLKPGERAKMRTELEKQVKEVAGTLDFVQLGLKGDREKLATKDGEGRALKQKYDGLSAEIGSLKTKISYAPTGTMEPHCVEGKMFCAEFDLLARETTSLRFKSENILSFVDDPAGIEVQISTAEVSASACAKELSSVGQELSAMDTERRAQDAKDRQSQLWQARAKLEKAQMALEALEKLKDDLLSSDEAGRFTQELNAVWKQFYPETNVLASPEGVFVNQTPSQVAASYLSTGQKVILDAAIRIAAAKTTGFGVLAMDDGNKLPVEEVGKLFRILRESGLQVIFVQTTAAVPPKAPEGISVYRLSSESFFGPVKCERVQV